MGRRHTDFIHLLNGNELHDRAVDALSRFRVEELRLEAREVFDGGTWISKGTKETLIENLAQNATPRLVKNWEEHAPEIEPRPVERAKRLLVEVLHAETEEELRRIKERIAEEVGPYG